jgi:hypothetical protein
MTALEGLNTSARISWADADVLTATLFLLKGQGLLGLLACCFL